MGLDDALVRAEVERDQPPLRDAPPQLRLAGHACPLRPGAQCTAERTLLAAVDELGDYGCSSACAESTGRPASARVASSSSSSERAIRTLAMSIRANASDACAASGAPSPSSR